MKTKDKTVDLGRVSATTKGGAGVDIDAKNGLPQFGLARD